jgi:hypothetical protein
MSQTGGREFGRGLHGYTMTVRGRSRDHATLTAELAKAPLPWTLWCLPVRSARAAAAPHRVELRDAASASAFLRVLGLAGSERTVAKRFMSGVRAGRAEVAFAHELAMNQRVRAAYGGEADAARRFTTLVSPLRWRGEEVIAIHVPRADAYYTLGERCDVPLDKLAFEARHIEPFVTQILGSFARLHAGGLVHADVKLDNMILCGADTFKLIDWGATLTLEGLREVYRRTLSPKNSASPMAWFAWGLGPLAPQTSLIVIAKMPRCGALLLESSRFRAFCRSLRASYRTAIERLVAGAPGRSEAHTRMAVVRAHARSFDLFNFGLLLESIACWRGAAHLGVALDARVSGLARRLTHYADPEFLGNDAQAALRWWRNELVRQSGRDR